MSEERCEKSPTGEFIVFKKDNNNGNYIKIPLIELDRKSKCFKKIPACSNSCDTYTKKTHYPCRKQKTIFESRDDYLDYMDMREERRSIHDYDRSEIHEKVIKANKDLKAEIKENRKGNIYNLRKKK